MKFIPKISFPVLGKELVEQSNRKRTYIIRCVFTVLMSTVFLIAFSNESSGETLGLWELRNIGRTLFATIIVVQFISVIIILPSSMATVITLEKERNSLELLLLTKLRPWEIIMQKYFSRIIPILMFTFLSLPLLAVSYAIGGFEFEILWYFSAELLMLIFFIGAIGILNSSFFRSSVSSVILTYIAVGLFLFFVFILLVNSRFRMGNEFESFLIGLMVFQGIITITSLILSVFFLKMRKHSRKRNLFMVALKSIDKFWKDFNSITGGIEIIKSENYKLPSFNPVRWYEKYKRPAGRLHYLARIVILITVPILFIYLMVAFGTDSYHSFGQIMMIILFVILTICLIAKGSSIVADEKQNQTLSVLLTTQVTSKQIIKERMRGIKKLKFAIGVPITILTIMIVSFGPGTRRWGGYYNSQYFSWQYPVLIAVYYFVYMDFLLWVSCWLGLKLKTNRRAVMGSFIFLALWMIIPFIPTVLREIFSRRYYEPYLFEAIAFFSPIMPFAKMLFKRELTLFPFFLSTLCMSVCYVFLRFMVMIKADRYLRK